MMKGIAAGVIDKHSIVYTFDLFASEDKTQ